MEQNQSPIWGIYDHVMANPSRYMIFDVDPGLGKSTIVPLWFADLGYRVLCSEALVATAKGNCEYVSALRGTRVGGFIGYRAGPDRVDSSDTRVLYCSDELGFMRELHGHNGRYNILLMNDIHDWTIAQEAFEALAWQGLCDGTSPFEKVIIMSGTLNAEELSRARGNAPIYHVRGTMHHIDIRQRGESMAADARRLLEEGYDVLAFMPGEGEIGDLLADVGDVRARKLMFYSELDAESKNQAFEFAPIPRLVAATNALEKGRNFVPSPGRALAVLDSGMERVMVMSRDGIERLSLQPIPLAKKEQRKRRTGRMGVGVYIDHCPVSDDARPQEPVAEIHRVRSDRTLLRFIVAGCDINTLPMLHKPDPEVIEQDRQLLLNLEAITAEGEATELGRNMSRFRLDMRYARSIIKAAELGVVDDVINLVALAHHEGIRDSESDLWIDHVCDETESDLLIELDLWRQCYGKPDSQLESMGVHVMNYKKVNSMRTEIRRIARSVGLELTSTGNREHIITAWISGFVDDLYHCDSGRYYSNGSDTRRLAGESVVEPDTEWIVGIPISMQVVLPDGDTFTRDVLKMVTKVRPEQLMELAPHLIGSRLENYRYYPPKDRVICWQTTMFGPHPVSRRVVYASGPQATAAIADYLAYGDLDLPFVRANRELQREINGLRSCAPLRIRPLSNAGLSLWYLDRIGEAQSLAAVLDSGIDLSMTDDDVSTLLDIDYPALRSELRSLWPEHVTIQGQVYPVEYRLHNGGMLPFVHMNEACFWNLRLEDMPEVSGIPVRVQLTDGLATGLIIRDISEAKPLIQVQRDRLRYLEELSDLHRTALALAERIDWSRMESYGLRPEENILRTIEQAGKALSSETVSYQTEKNKLANIVNRLTKVLRKYTERTA